jgi:hypothetical protein
VRIASVMRSERVAFVPLLTNAAGGRARVKRDDPYSSCADFWGG